MKKIAIFALSVMMIAGITSCGESDGGATSETTTTTPETTTPETKSETATTPESTAPALPVTTVSWSEEKHDFGKIKQGEKVQHTFRFNNDGDNPLKIENVKPSCGCTTPDWTKEEVAPGSEGYVTVEFDSKGKKGIQNKSVTVTGNMDGKIKVLSFTGEVVTDGE